MKPVAKLLTKSKPINKLILICYRLFWRVIVDKNFLDGCKFRILEILLILQMAGGQILPTLKKNCVFGTFLWSN